MRFLFTLALLITTLLNAKEDATDPREFSLRIGAGTAQYSDLKDVLKFNYEGYDENFYGVNLDAGWRAGRDLFDTPFDLYLKGGVTYFNERGYADDIWEGTLYFKVYGKIDFWDNRIRIGFGEGVSYTNEILEVEREDDSENGGYGTARLLNYLDISADIDIGRLIRVHSMRDLYLGYTIKHRSGVKGLYSGAHGGSNYILMTLEKNF